MEGCLVCLELKKEFVDTIDTKSSEWNELNIKHILDKYLWPMNHIESSSWMCNTCWRELYEFHQFYLRIEDAHKRFGLFTKNGEGSENADSGTPASQADGFEVSAGDVLEETPVQELKDILNESYASEEKTNCDLTIEELKPIIKNELNEETLIDKSPLTQKRKRGRPRKDITIVNKTIKNKKHKVKRSEAIRRLGSESKTRNAKGFTRPKNRIYSENMQETQLIAEVRENDSDSNNYSDRGSLELVESKLSINKICPPKIDHNEKDKFLAENFKITCFLCNIPFETFFNMRKHFDEQHTERGHVKCCNKKFYRRSILVDHVHYHLNPNYFKCNQCGKVMADRRCLELHVEIHESNHEKNHCCDICGKGFAKLGVLKKHRMIHLSEEEKRFSCSGCNKNFASNYLLSSHYRSVHLKKYAKICDICGKSIRCKDVFERHMLQHEGKTAPPVNCDVCGLVLTDKKALKRHKDVIHPVGGQHEYTCSICSKTSPNLRAHKRHVQYKHVMGYDHKCTICDKAFKRAPTLKEHMASHTGTILYTCPWCPKTFNSNANMHNHRKKVHPKEWEEASRKRYSGNLPPNFKPPTLNGTTDFNVPMDV